MASAFAVVTPRMLPIKQLLLTFAPDLAPIQITLLAVVTPLPAPTPKAVLPLPVVLLERVAPMAVLSAPVVLFERTSPVAVLLLPWCC